jgi:hypothetical protein
MRIVRDDNDLRQACPEPVRPFDPSTDPGLRVNGDEGLTANSLDCSLSMIVHDVTLYTMVELRGCAALHVILRLTPRPMRSISAHGLYSAWQFILFVAGSISILAIQ